MLKSAEVAVEDLEHSMRGILVGVDDNEITCDIPDGQTRKVDIPTFDRQHSFYYRLSQSPRRQASPFDVPIRILSLMLDVEC